MITANICTSLGISNGTIGEIVDIIYAEEGDVQNERLPKAIVIRSETFKLTARDAFYYEGDEKTFAIMPIKR